MHLVGAICALSQDLPDLKEAQRLADLQVVNLFSDSDGRVVGAKFLHVPTGAPVFLLRIEGVPQLFTWVNTPVDSNRGLPHSLEHLLLGKGTKGHYFQLLENMRLSTGGAGTSPDFVSYGFASDSGADDFFEILHALLDALYRPDFSDLEAEQEFYHFNMSTDQQGGKVLSEGGTVYNEMAARENLYDYYYEITKKLFGTESSFGFESGGKTVEMRGVLPDEIRTFYEKWYHIGPSTGFIFSFPPRYRLQDVLPKISSQLGEFATPNVGSVTTVAEGPQYSLHSSKVLDPAIYPFPNANDFASGTVQLAWRPKKVPSLRDLQFLELFCQGFAKGENSPLQKLLVDSETRASNLGATGVDGYLLPEGQPWFPAPSVEISGIQGNKITQQSLEEIRSLVLNAIRIISKYPDGSSDLANFNRTVLSAIVSLRRSKSVWTKSPPGFQENPPRTEWKQFFERLDMDKRFAQSLSEDQLWESIQQELASGKNVWRDLIENFRLLDPPFITAGVPSAKLLKDIEASTQQRLQTEMSTLQHTYGTSNDQETLSRFEQDEMLKEQKIVEVESKVQHPSFTDHPPLVPDDEIRYSQFSLHGVPTIATFFDRPPTIDIGLSFNLRKLPERFYKYLPLIPECLTSLGIKKGNQVVPYAEFARRIQEETNGLSVDFEGNPASGRLELVVRASAANANEFRNAMGLVKDALNFNDLDSSNLGRLRDIVARRIAKEADLGTDVADFASAGFFLYRHDHLFIGVSYEFTVLHRDERLSWLLHEPTKAPEIEHLSQLAKDTMSAEVCSSRQSISDKLNASDAKGVDRELIEYWKRNLYSFPESELCAGLRRLTLEVQQDLRTGPDRTLAELKELQRFIFNRPNLHLDVTSSEPVFMTIRTDLDDLLRSIPAVPEREEFRHKSSVSRVRESPPPGYDMASEQRPIFLGLLNPSLTNGDVIFYSDFPGYSQVDQKTLEGVLASTLFGGSGPHSFWSRSWARGLAYYTTIGSDLRLRIMWYQAAKSPDIPALISLVNATVDGVQTLDDQRLVDYALAQFFASSRKTRSTADRGRAMAYDLRDGNDPKKIRRLSEAVLRLRQKDDLVHVLKAMSLASACGVLLRTDCREIQSRSHSVLFFVGTEQTLANIEKHTPVGKLKRVYPCDFWMEDGDSKD
jgi:hypothetical protein